MIEYELATTRRELAKERYNRASVDLELARIKERLAEIKSQSNPLNTLIQFVKDDRERLYAAAFYVVVGRTPDRLDP